MSGIRKLVANFHCFSTFSCPTYLVQKPFVLLAFLIPDQQNLQQVKDLYVPKVSEPSNIFNMIMRETTNSNPFSSLQFCRPLILLCKTVLIIISIIGFICHVVFGFSHFVVTIPVLFLSTVLVLLFTKRKGNTLDETPATNQRNQKVLLEEEFGEELHQVDENGKETVIYKLNPVVETDENCIETILKSENGRVHDYQAELLDVSSESEGRHDLEPSEKLEPSSKGFNKVGQNLALICDSDSSVSVSDYEYDDDDSLIEISLPGSESSGLEDEPRQNLQSKLLVDFLPESILRQKRFKDFMAEINDMNEEENLIEIDISIGSIKCPNLGY